MQWIKLRMQLPSSMAAVGAAMLGVGVLTEFPLLIIGGIVFGCMGFSLKEKGGI